MNPILYFLWALVCPSMDQVQMEENFHKYYYTIATIESDVNQYAKNKHSSASSYFQVTKGSFALAKKRASKYGFEYTANHITKLDYMQQMEMLFLDLYARKGTNRYIQGILKGDRDVAMQAYLKYHHTAAKVGSPTYKRAKQKFKEIYNA